MAELEKDNEKRKDSSSGHILRFVILLVLAAAVLLAIYLRLTNHSKNSDRQADENYTETEILKQYDLEKQYPKTVREVVKLHCRFLKCIYNEELSAEELETLNRQCRNLYSDILLSENGEREQLADLTEDISAFHSAGKIFVNYTVGEESSILYTTENGVDYAMVTVTCNIREGSGTNALEEQYLLIKEKEQWKILGWQGVVPEETLVDDTGE